MSQRIMVKIHEGQTIPVRHLLRNGPFAQSQNREQ